MIRRFLIVIALMLLVAWLGSAVLGRVVGRFAVAHFDHVLESIGASKVPDHVEYVAARMTDALWLLTITWLFCLFIVVVSDRVTKSRSRLAPWIAGAVFFVALNIWCLLAAHTALFWLILRGKSVENQAQFRAKENMMREVKIRPFLALVGSSQSQRQFTEEIFNADVGGKAWMMEFAYPGAQSEDVFYIGERFSGESVTALVYYLSFVNIYATNRDSASARDLLRLCDLPQTLSLGSWHYFYPTTARYSALGMISPLFQYRASFQHAFLGPTALPANITAAPKVDTSRLTNMGFGPEAEYQKEAFRRMVEHCASKGQRVILVVGQMNPAYEARVDPAILQDFHDFIKTCAAAYPNLILVQQNDLLVQPPEDYDSDAHVNKETSEKFTHAFAQWYLAHPLTEIKPGQ